MFWDLYPTYLLTKTLAEKFPVLFSSNPFLTTFVANFATNSGPENQIQFTSISNVRHYTCTMKGIPFFYFNIVPALVIIITRLGSNEPQASWTL